MLYSHTKQGTVVVGTILTRDDGRLLFFTCRKIHQQHAQRVHQEMPRASLSMVSAIVAPDARHLSGCDTLAVQCPGSGVRVTSRFPAHRRPQRIVDVLPRAIVTPLPEIMRDALPLRIVFRHHAPLAAAHHNIQHGMHHLPHIQAARSATRLCGRDHIVDTLPLMVGHIGWVCLWLHTPTWTTPDTLVVTFSDNLLVKLAKNGRFWHGLNAQLPKYLEAQEVQYGYFIVIVYKNG